MRSIFTTLISKRLWYKYEEGDQARIPFIELLSAYKLISPHSLIRTLNKNKTDCRIYFLESARQI